MQKTDVIDEYEKVRTSLENAISKADDINIAGEEENIELQNIRATLQQLNAGFKEEISTLENSSEWDRFCMAFFGETNAGKSTIIEALRIVYDEESRREKLMSQKVNYNRELSDNTRDYDELKQKLSELNRTLTNNKNTRIKRVLKTIGLVFLGIVIGFVIAFLTIR